MSPAGSVSYRVQPLGSAHDRADFVSGEPELDTYFHQRVSQDVKRKVAVAFVMVDDAGVVAGYYTLSAYSIRLTDLPVVEQKKVPKYPLVPATLLGRLAVRHDLRGQKLGQWLLIEALQRCWRATTQVASAAVVVHALNDAAKSFYMHHEFRPLANHPSHLFLAMRTIEEMFTSRP